MFLFSEFVILSGFLHYNTIEYLCYIMQVPWHLWDCDKNQDLVWRTRFPIEGTTCYLSI